VERLISEKTNESQLPIKSEDIDEISETVGRQVRKWIEKEKNPRRGTKLNSS
jgi:hypothetical protein